MKTRKEAVNDAVQTTLKLILCFVIIGILYFGISLFKATQEGQADVVSKSFNNGITLKDKLVEKRRESSLSKSEQELFNKILDGSYKTNEPMDKAISKRIKNNIIYLIMLISTMIVVFIFLRALSYPEKIEPDVQSIESSNEE